MRPYGAGLAFLQFDWSKANLSMDLPVFVYSNTKISFKFLSRESFLCAYRSFTSSNTERTLQGSCFVCQGLLIIEIVICIHYLIGSSPHAVRPTTLSFCMSVNMYVFNVEILNTQMSLDSDSDSDWDSDSDSETPKICIEKSEYRKFIPIQN